MICERLRLEFVESTLNEQRAEKLHLNASYSNPGILIRVQGRIIANKSRAPRARESRLGQQLVVGSMAAITMGALDYF